MIDCPESNPRHRTMEVALLPPDGLALRRHGREARHRARPARPRPAKRRIGWRLAGWTALIVGANLIALTVVVPVCLTAWAIEKLTRPFNRTTGPG